MKKKYIIPEFWSLDIPSEGFLTMSFSDGSGNDHGSSSLSTQDVDDNTDSWSGAW